MRIYKVKNQHDLAYFSLPWHLILTNLFHYISVDLKYVWLTGLFDIIFVFIISYIVISLILTYVSPNAHNMYVS